jgi:hypothetical protein
MSITLASQVSARVESLISRHHGGDRRAAARRLGIETDRLAGLLSGDWCRFSLDALAALVRGYGVSVDWLVASDGGTGSTPAASDRTTDRTPSVTAADDG